MEEVSTAQTANIAINVGWVLTYLFPKDPYPSRSSRFDGRNIPSPGHRIIGENPFLGTYLDPWGELLRLFCFDNVIFKKNGLTILLIH